MKKEVKSYIEKLSGTSPGIDSYLKIVNDYLDLEIIDDNHADIFVLYCNVVNLHPELFASINDPTDKTDYVSDYDVVIISDILSVVKHHLEMYIDLDNQSILN